MKIDEIVAFSCIAIIFNSLDVFSLLAAIRDRMMGYDIRVA